MAGEAKSTAFMLGTATVMLGARADLFDLNPTDHSIGLVKNFRVMSEPAYTDLTQGVKNTIVYSVMTGNTVRASMEVFEYTGRNLTYALGLEGSDVVAQTVATTVTTASTAEAATLTVESATGITAGDQILIQHGTSDHVLVRRVVSVASDVLTVFPALEKVVPIGAKVMKANALQVGSKEDQPFLAAKIVGMLADGTEVVLLCPKIRITNGFSVGFMTDNFDNLPYELAFYDLVTGDPFFAEFGGAQAKLLTRK